MEPAPESKRYRKNVAVVVLNEEGKILACRRSDEFKTWQLPQGGIDPLEKPEEAMLRELEEEIGTTEVKILGNLPEPIRYDWPPSLYSRGFHGQEQYYFLVRLKKNAVIDLNRNPPAEFEAYSWLTAREFFQRLEGFKVEAYTRAILSLKKFFPGIIAD